MVFIVEPSEKEPLIYFSLTRFYYVFFVMLDGSHQAKSFGDFKVFFLLIFFFLIFFSYFSK